ncbi:MAG: lysophospholipid acyltransferase family protein [Candidatus Omnitrophica bacterium]|nr:lysophospholipid acyltransferase family protein [Candidatus Omnitrophota bacterium]
MRCNWELGGVVISLLGYPFSAVALPHKHKKVDAFFNHQRRSKGIKVVPLGKAVRQCLDILKKNEALALVGDRDFTEKGIVLDFFGKPCFFPEGAAAFSLKTGAAIVPGFMIRNKNDGFTLRFEKPLEFSPSGNRNPDIAGIIKLYKGIFEDYIRRYPDQWYAFRRFWIS